MPAFYRRTPRRVANTNGSNGGAQKSPSSYKKSPLAAVKNPGGRYYANIMIYVFVVDLVFLVVHEGSELHR